MELESHPARDGLMCCHFTISLSASLLSISIKTEKRHVPVATILEKEEEERRGKKNTQEIMTSYEM